jgi:hypothetical protein
VTDFSLEDWTPEEQERLLALAVVRDPWWYGPVHVALLHLPFTGNLLDRLFRYQMRRAVALYRRGLR